MKNLIKIMQNTETTGLILSFLTLMVFFIFYSIDERLGGMNLFFQIFFIISLFGILMSLVKKSKYVQNKIFQIENPNSKITQIDLPQQFRTGFQQYLLFFKDFVKDAKGRELNLNIFQNDTGLSITVKTEEKLSPNTINDWLDEYMGFLKQESDNLKIKFEYEATEADVDILILKLENQISHLKNSLKITKLENHHLSSQINYLKELSFKFAERHTINKQIIHGGTQQFADKIKN